MSGSVTVAGEGAGATGSMAVADAATGLVHCGDVPWAPSLSQLEMLKREHFFITVIMSGLDVMGSSDQLAVSGQRGVVAGSGMAADVMDVLEGG